MNIVRATVASSTAIVMAFWNVAKMQPHAGAEVCVVTPFAEIGVSQLQAGGISVPKAA